MSVNYAPEDSLSCVGTVCSRQILARLNNAYACNGKNCFSLIVSGCTGPGFRVQQQFP